VEVNKTNDWPTSKRNLIKRHYKEFSNFINSISFEEFSNFINSISFEELNAEGN
jgi:hypothetical protein